ncbi:hypothetical protein L9F63_001958, partial [Diploptera punctata]
RKSMVSHSWKTYKNYLSGYVTHSKCATDVCYRKLEKQFKGRFHQHRIFGLYPYPCHIL